MVLTPETRDRERRRIAAMVLNLVKERGTEIPYTVAVTESGLSRARFEQLFEDEDALFDAVAAMWLSPNLEVMEEVLASELSPPRKMYEFFRRRFVISQKRWREDPEYFRIACEMGAANFEKVRSYVDLADHYLCELIVQAQADGYFSGLEIEDALSLINQIVSCYTMPDSLLYLGEKLSEEKLAQIVDTMFAGLEGGGGTGLARGINTLKVAS